MNRTLQKANTFLMPNYGVMGMEITSGNGVWVWTKNANGKKRKCFDCLVGLGVNSLGHCHPEVMTAIFRQANILMHVSNLYATPPMAELAERLAELTSQDKNQVFFCNDGTGANEAAAKLARIWAHENYGPKKNKIIALRNSFHGRTWMSITMTGQTKMQEKFAPGVPRVKFAELNNLIKLRRIVDNDVCAVIFETIQAEGGVNEMYQSFYDEIHRLSQLFNFLRIVDEVQTGIGRTGAMFSFRHFEDGNHTGPEIITLAKALGGGLPIGAVIARGEIGDSLLAGSHAATFGGNPVACAAALAVLDVIKKENLLEKIRQTGFSLRDAFNALAKKYDQKIFDVRGRGFMIGVELREGYKAADVVKAMYEKGVLIGTAGPQVVRFLPPFIATEKELDMVLEKFEQVIKNL